MVDVIFWAIVGLVILYVIIRIAVREGILDALAKVERFLIQVCTQNKPPDGIRPGVC